MGETYAEQARVFKAFCDENRLKILDLLRPGELCACKLLEALDISQSTLSHHMQILCGAGVVTGRREGKWTHYTLDPEGIQRAGRLLEKLADGR